MRFHLRRKPDDRPAGEHDEPWPGDSSFDSRTGAASPEAGIDLDRWAELGVDALDSAGSLDTSGGDDPSPIAMGGSLRDRLLAVLAEDDGSLVPPSAGDMTQAEWDSLTEIEREGYRREQLKKLDPRIVPRHTMGPSRAGSRSARAYR